MRHQFVTLLGIGHLTPGPGTWGSLAALPLALVLLWLGGPWLLVAATVVVVVAGFAAVRCEITVADPDPGHVVIDEVAGQWIALWPVAFGAVMAEVSYTALWPGWVAAFFLFRAFDIAKPGPVGWADRQKGAYGVMMDDVIAGLLAAGGVVVLAAGSHALMRL
jgi:phosphatidylglycerophosphatase A